MLHALEIELSTNHDINTINTVSLIRQAMFTYPGEGKVRDRNGTLQRLA